MKFGVTLLVIAVGISTLPSAYAGPPRSVDVRNFDVAGVKTGMDFDQALAAIAKNFQVEPSQIRHSPMKVNHPVTGTVLKHPITQVPLPTSLFYEKEGVRLEVLFIARMPLDEARPTVVTRVSYQMPTTGQNMTAMEEAVLAKYGEPTEKLKDSKTSAMLWCHQPISSRVGTTCIDFNNQQPILHFLGHNTNLKLVDPNWDVAIRESAKNLQKERDKAREDSLRRKPSF